MENLKKILIGTTSLVFSVVVLMQCTSSWSNTKSGNNDTTTQIQSVSQDISKGTSSNESSYINLYDGRATFPDSVHKSWQDGTLDEVRTSVLEYIDGMISGIQSDIEKYEKEVNQEKLDIEMGKLKRVEGLKEKILAAKEKTEIRNLMHEEFRYGTYKDIYGSGN